MWVSKYSSAADEDRIPVGRNAVLSGKLLPMFQIYDFPSKRRKVFKRLC